MIERLLVLANNQREYDRFELQLIFTNTEELCKIYARQEPKLIARGERYKRILRRQDRRAAMVAKLKSDEAYFAEWSRKWRLPRFQYPLNPHPSVRTAWIKGASKEVLSFGLRELYETALWLWLHNGDQDAAATCKMIGVKPEHKPLLHYPPSRFKEMVRQDSFSNLLHGAMKEGGRNGHGSVEPMKEGIPPKRIPDWKRGERFRHAVAA